MIKYKLFLLVHPGKTCNSKVNKFIKPKETFEVDDDKEEIGDEDTKEGKRIRVKNEQRGNKITAKMEASPRNCRKRSKETNIEG